MSDSHEEDNSEPESFEDYLRKQRSETAMWKAVGNGDLEVRAKALIKIAYDLSSDTLKLDEAIAAAGAAADIWRELERNLEFVMAIWHVGDCLIECERFAEAVQAYESAIEVGDEHLMTREMSAVHFQISRCYTRLDLEAEAERAAVKAAELSIEAKVADRGPRAYMMASDFARYQKKWAEAAEYCAKAIVLLKEKGAPDDLAEAYARRAQNLIDLEHYADAGDCLDRSRNLTRLVNMDWLNAGLSFHRARLWAATGMAAEALPLFEEALQGAKDKNAGAFAAEVLFCRAKAYLELGDIELARTEIEALITMTEDGQTELDKSALENLMVKCRPQPVLFEVAC